MTGILSLWDAIVEAGAVIAIVVIAIGLMVRVIDGYRAFARLGAVCGALVLLLILPPILLSLWHSLSVWQQLGIILLSWILGLIVLRRRPHRDIKRRGASREH